MRSATVMSVPPYRRSLDDHPARRAGHGRRRFGHDRVGLQRPEQRRPAVEVVGRVAQGEVERPGRPDSSQPGQRGPHDGAGSSPAPPPARFWRTAARAPRVQVDEGRRRRTPGERLEAERAAAAEEVDHAQALDTAREPRMSKMASRTRSDVGRTVGGSLASSRRPRLRPPMTRIAPTLRRPGPPAGARSEAPAGSAPETGSALEEVLAFVLAQEQPDLVGQVGVRRSWGSSSTRASATRGPRSTAPCRRGR